MTVLFIKKIGGQRAQRGATLIELMVSVFIFAIGVLGYSALQTRSLQATFDVGQRAEVVAISEGLIARINARNNLATRLAYTGLLNGANVCAAPATVCAETQGGVMPAACTPAQFAAYDVWEELCNNPNGGLSAVQGLQITLTCNGGPACPDFTGMTLTSTWCERTAEQDVDLDTAAGASVCVKDIAQQNYTLAFQ